MESFTYYKLLKECIQGSLLENNVQINENYGINI